MTTTPPPGPGEPTTPGGYGAGDQGTPPGYDAGYGDTAAYGTTAAAPAKTGGRRGVAIGVGAAVLVAVGGAGIWAATQLSGGGRQPDAMVPKTTFAYAAFDLDPEMNQKLAARSFFSKFPELKDKVGNEDSVFEDFLGELLNDPDLNFERDVKPWFDKRAGVAAFPGSNGPEVVGVLRSKDDGKAKVALDKAVAEAQKEGEEIAYRLADGYAVVGDPDGVDDAIRLTESGSLADNEVYTADVEKLEGDQVVVAWANIGEAFQSFKSEIPNAGLLPNMLTDQIKGRVVAGLHLTDDYAEVQGFTLGAEARNTPQAATGTDLLTSLPDSITAALSISGVATGLDQAGSGLDVDQLLAQYLQGSGLSFTRDVQPMLSDQMVAVLGSFTNPMQPSGALLSKVDDPEAAEAGGAKVAALLSFFGIEVKADAVGDTFALGTPASFVDTVTKGGNLGSSPRFTKATGDLKNAGMVLYFDATKSGGTPLGEAPEGLGAVGMVVGQQGSDAFFRFRVVAE